MSAGLQITGWPAHDSAISSVMFGSDETSIFTLGIDGKASYIAVIQFTLFFFLLLHIFKGFTLLKALLC